MKISELGGIKRYITNNRNKYAYELRGTDSYWYLSAATYSFYNDILKVINDIHDVDVLDAGAGGLNGKSLFEGHYKSYTSMDIDNRTGEIDIVGDIQDMSNIASNKFDVVYSSQVLEHVPEPRLALAEMKRVLRDQGVLILTVPHLSPYHEIPHDYFRFTRFGVEHMLKKEGLKIQEVIDSGGLFGFLSHPVSVILIALTWRIPFLKWIVFYFNKYIIVYPSYLLDNWLLLRKIFPINVISVAIKNNLH